jgi:hypothetical protein
MWKWRTITLFVILPWLSLGAYSFAAVDLSDSQALALVSSRVSGFAIPFGEIYVSPDLPADHNTIDSIGRRTHSFLKAFAGQGLIVVKPGVGAHIILISPTPRGEELAREGGLPQSKEKRWMYLKTSVRRDERLVKNEAIRSGVDDYRVIMTSYSVTWAPFYRQAAEKVGLRLLEKRKVRQLYKHDPITSSWKAVAGDNGNIDEEFETDRVPSALMILPR